MWIIPQTILKVSKKRTDMEIAVSLFDKIPPNPANNFPLPISSRMDIRKATKKTFPVRRIRLLPRRSEAPHATAQNLHTGDYNVFRGKSTLFTCSKIFSGNSESLLNESTGSAELSSRPYIYFSYSPTSVDIFNLDHDHSSKRADRRFKCWTVFLCACNRS